MSEAQTAQSTATNHSFANNNTILGGVMHRFPTDKSIRGYCKEHGMENPAIDDFGGVFATQQNYDGSNAIEVQIGWTF